MVVFSGADRGILQAPISAGGTIPEGLADGTTGLIYVTFDSV